MSFSYDFLFKKKTKNSYLFIRPISQEGSPIKLYPSGATSFAYHFSPTQLVIPTS